MGVVHLWVGHISLKALCLSVQGETLQPMQLGFGFDVESDVHLAFLGVHFLFGYFITTLHVLFLICFFGKD